MKTALHGHLPLNRAMALIGGKWKMQILCSLYNNGPTRYTS